MSSNTREYSKLYMRQYRQREKWKSYNLVLNRAYQKTYASNNPEKIKAHWVANYLRRHIKKDSCLGCSAKDVELHMHHPDYTRPDYVLTLCVDCHEGIHHDA